MALRTSVLALAAVTVLLLASGGTTSARKLQDSRRYTIDLVNTFAKGRDNRVTQDVGISLDAPELMNEKDVGAEPVNPITMDPNNPRCDIDHKYAYPAFQLTDEPIGSTLRDGRRGLLSDSDDSDDDDDDDSEKKKKEKKKSSEDSEESEDSEDSEESEDSEDELEESRERSDRDTKTVEVFVGTDFQVKPVFVARVNGRVRGESQADVTGSGIEAALTLDEEVPMRTACGDWVYNSNGRYSWTFFVDNQAETRLYYYVNSAPGNSQETYDRMPVNVNYAHEYTVAGSDNNVNSDSRIDTGNRGGTVKMTLDNVIAGAGNRFEQTGRTGVNQDDTPILG